MSKLSKNQKLLIGGGLMAGAIAAVINSQNFETTGKVEFRGKIARKYEDSVEWWPEPVTPPEGAPNVLMIMLDDTGYAQLGAYGGLINTPNIDRLARRGLLYNNFHTTALSSPSRASVMSGRNPHSIGLGSHSITAMGFPGYNAHTPPTARPVSKTLEKQGYVNYAVGKWDHTPLRDVSQVGPFDYWPSGEGYQHFYGFMAGDTDNFRPALFDGHTPINPWRGKKDYHLSEDLADKGIEYIRNHTSLTDKPFMMYWAPVAMHAPHQAPKEYIKKYEGKFDMGWDEARKMILRNQKRLGIVPQNTVLTKRPEKIPAWNSLDDDHKKMYAKQMEVFAGMLEHVDVQIGRIIDDLEKIGQLDNTLIILTSDNGASAEGGLAGTHNELYALNGLPTPFEENFERIDDWGGRDMYPHYHAGWTMAGNTPFQYFKQTTHGGGIKDPLIMYWKGHMTDVNYIRNQYHHISDIAPTILEATGIDHPKYIEGVKQKPLDGVSMLYTFKKPKAKTKKKVQYYEMFGNRAIWKDDWVAVTLHGQRMPWELDVTYPFEGDVWELYNVKEDFAEAKNLADKYPAKLEELKKEWDRQAWKYDVYPLYDDMIMRFARQQDRAFEGKRKFVYYSPSLRKIGETVSPPVKNKSHTIKTTIDLKGNEKGVIVAVGGHTGGFTMFIKDDRLFYVYRNYDHSEDVLKSEFLPKGKTELKFKFKKTGNYKGKGFLYVNGELQDEVSLSNMRISAFSASESFDVGGDSGVPVSKMYKKEGLFKFRGDLNKVVITIDEKY